MPVTYTIHGGKKLSGSLSVTGGKNAPVALLAASLLIEGEVTLAGMTHVEEVLRMLEVLKSIGVRFRWIDETAIWLDTSGPIRMKGIDRKACAAIRSSLLLFGALAPRESAYRLYRSGGCHLGERTVRPHMFALKKLGVHITTGEGTYSVRRRTLHGEKVVMYESGDTPTENVIMAAVRAKGTTVITFASANYMVQDVCYFLQAAGAIIDGIGTTTLTITGVPKLHGGISYMVSPDPVDAMAWIALAITTRSSLTIRNCPMDFLELELEKLRVMGQKVLTKNARKSKNGKFSIADITLPISRLTALPDKIYGRPFPGLNIDALPFFVPILTVAKGRTLVHDWVYENRAVYFLELQKLGASVPLLDPHRLFVEGPSALHSSNLQCPKALRPGMAILIAMLAARGTSTMRNVYQIERGYGDVAARLRKIGAEIERIEE